MAVNQQVAGQGTVRIGTQAVACQYVHEVAPDDAAGDPDRRLVDERWALHVGADDEGRLGLLFGQKVWLAIPGRGNYAVCLADRRADADGVWLTFMPADAAKYPRTVSRTMCVLPAHVKSAS